MDEDPEYNRDHVSHLRQRSMLVPTEPQNMASLPHLPFDQPGWMSQIQPVPMEHFPQAPGPMVYEGFVPQSARELETSSNHNKANAIDFPWPAQKALPVARRVGPDAIDPALQGGMRSPTVYPQPPGMNDHWTPVDRHLLVNQSDADDFEAFDDTDGYETAINEPAPTIAQKRKYTRRSARELSKDIRITKQPARPVRKRGRKKGEKRGPRQVLDPGDEFNRLHAQATEAFLDKTDHESAIQFILQAISINPEIYSAHVLLSEIYFSQGESDKAVAALFSGAHATPNDKNVWHQLADACMQKSTGDRETVLNSATYCYARIIGIDPKDTEARFRKAAISKELGHHAKALKDLDFLHKMMPFDSDVLRQIAEVCLDHGDVSKARTLYEEGLEARRSGRVEKADTFNWSDLIVYVDLVAYADGIEIAIQTLKDISRWLLGREDEWFWNSSTNDDCEWDAAHEPRRVKVPAFRPGRFPVELYGPSLPLDLRVKLGDFRLTEGKIISEALMHFDWLEPDVRGEESNVYEYPDLFLQAADALRSFKQFQQAYRYYNALNSINAYDDAEFWLGIGACAYACGAKEEALGYYQNAKLADPRSVEACTQLSKLYADRGDRTQAVQHARLAMKLCEAAAGTGLKRKYERKEAREARQAAQQVYRNAYMLSPPPGEKRTNNNEPVFSRRAREKKRRAQVDAQERRDNQATTLITSDGRDKVPRQSKKKVMKAQRTKEQQENVVRQLYANLCANTHAMRTGDEEARSIWIECAEQLVEEFRSQKSFFPAERYKTFQGYETGLTSKKNRLNDQSNEPEGGNQEDIPMPSIENVIPNGYCGIVFSSWLDVFLEYATLLANLQYDRSDCYTILNAAQDCTIWYHDVNAMTQIHVCYVVCALALHDESIMVSTAMRWLMREYAFCSDVYRLFSALNFYFPHAADRAGKAGSMSNAKFRIPPNQKFLFRHIVSLDSQLPEDYGIDTPYGPVPSFMRKERHEAGLGYLNFQGLAEHTASKVPETQRSNTTRGTQGSPTLGQTPDNEAGGTRGTRPTEMEIHLLILYGQILYAGGSFPNALSYFYRAMSLSPDSPVLLLTMALCYLHQMMKRQCDNRHTYFLQGLALFERYAETRISWAEEQEEARRRARDASGMAGPNLSGLVDEVRREIEYNRARCWHMVGMSDLAVRGYTKMIEMKPMKREDDDVGMDVDRLAAADKYSMEAAYATMLIYATNGDIETARAITEKYLVIE